MTDVHVIAFADPDAETWGVGWMPEFGSGSQIAVSYRAASGVLHVGMVEDEPDDVWHVEGDGVALAFEPTGPPGHGRVEFGELNSVDQLCAVTGRLRVEGNDSEVSCLGWRSAIGSPAISSLESFRFLAGWPGPDQGFSLTALRPRRARGHDTDIVAAAVIDDPPPPPVADPRLSTTYTEAGLPLRAGLELWFAEETGGEGESRANYQYPRRAAAEASGPALAWEQSGFQLHASLLRWRSHGHAGPGVYLLGRRQ